MKLKTITYIEITALILSFIVLSGSFYLLYNIYHSFGFSHNFIQASHLQAQFTEFNNSILIQNVSCFKLRGASMQPALFEGNQICFRPIKYQSIQSGQIISYNHEGERITHRIRAVINENEIIVQGDNTKFAEKINFSQINGVAVAIILT